MDLRREFARRRKDGRFVAAALAVLLAALTFIYYLIQSGRDLPSTLVTNKVLLFFLRNVNMLLILVICFVLARNLVRLWLERRQRALGARFKTKLVATYVGLALVPVLLLFFYASELLQGAVDRWFSGSLRNVLEQSAGIAQELQTTITERNARDAGRLARELASTDLGEPAARERAVAKLAGWREELAADYLALFDGTDFVRAVVEPRSGIADLPELGRSFLAEVLEKGHGGRLLSPVGTRGRLLLSAAAAPPGRERRAVVAVGTLLAPGVAAQSEQLIQAFQTYRQLEVQKSEFKASYLLTFLLVTLLILLASAWLGLFLARRLMAPIQALAEGTRRVTAGDLDAAIDVAADDEMAAVVDSFNRMTGELRRNRELIGRSHGELVAANRSLAEERALLAAILDNLAAGVVSIDRTGRVVSVNRAALAMLRQREQDLLGRAPAEAWNDPERAPIATFAASRAGERPSAAAEITLVRAGDRRTLRAKAIDLVDTTGGPAGEVLVLEELTELVKAQRLAAWTEAARRIAHEIKNPLTPIRLSAERLRKRFAEAPGPLAGLVEESVEIIVREVTTMQALVDEFSAYAKMPGPQIRATYLSGLADDVLALYREIKPGVVIRSAIARDIGAVWLDPDQIRRVLINLLDNALEATEPPGEIVVAAERTEDGLALSVADSGRGIPNELRDKLFLPYFSTKKRGTGMGLAIVHRIVTEHGGTIRVDDNAPHGSVFSVLLPLR